MSSAADSISMDGPIRPKKFFGAPLADLRPAAVYPAKQVPGIALIFGVAGMCVWGLYRVALSNQRRGRERTEMQIARVNLIPVLQAEADRRYIRQKKANIEEEEKVMDGVEGWVVGESVYKTRWMPPTSYLPNHKL